MTGREILRLGARNNSWANGVLHAAVAQLTAEAFHAERSGFFPSIRETLNHILAIDLYYLDAIEEGGKGRAIFTEYEGREAAAPLAEAQAAADRRLIAFCDTMSDSDLDREVMTDRGHAGEIAERLGDLIPHLIQHQVHHRGQVHAMLSDAGVAPPQLDDFHLRYGRDPAAAAIREA